jgi:hypothetical protein
LLNIVRVDNEGTRTHAWRVQIQRQNKVIYKYFSDGVFGGKKSALLAAKTYLGALLSDRANVDWKMWRRTQMRPTNTSGVTGIGRYSTTKVQADGQVKIHYSWQAFWKDADGRRRARSFSVSIYGEDEARELAKKARRDGLREVKRVLTNKAAKRWEKEQ